jgi:hypothetical protein
MLPILARTSNHVKSLFLLARVRGLPQRIDVQPLLIQGFLLPGTREKQGSKGEGEQGRGWVFPHSPFSFAQKC